MNTYEFRYKRQYPVKGCYRDITAEEKLARLIDSDWHYSWHWPKELSREWVEEVRKDLDTEVKRMVERREQLFLAEKILNKLELLEEEE